jgi:hypothetical protein
MDDWSFCNGELIPSDERFSAPDFELESKLLSSDIPVNILKVSVPLRAWNTILLNLLLIVSESCSLLSLWSCSKCVKPPTPF